MMTWWTARVERAKATIQKYIGRYGMLCPADAEELENAYKELDEAQKACHHTYDTVMTFTSHSRRCRYCDLLDPS